MQSGRGGEWREIAYGFRQVAKQARQTMAKAEDHAASPGGGKAEIKAELTAMVQKVEQVHSYLTQSVLRVILRISIPTYIRQLIIYMSNGEG